MQTLEPRRIRFTLNGETVEVLTPPGRRLVDVLRMDLGLTGTKVGCEQGECGACTVLVDGEAVNSCLVLVTQVEGRNITTIEALEKDGQLHPLQEAFVDAGAIQCGFCTPGFVMSAYALLQKNPSPSRAQIVEAVAGNLCRCTGYKKIFEAIERAAGTPRGDRSS